MSAKMKKKVKLWLRAMGVIGFAEAAQRYWISSSRRRLELFVLSKLRDENIWIDPKDIDVTVGVVWETRLNQLLDIQESERVRVLRIPRAVFHPGWFRYLRSFVREAKSVPMGEYSLDHYFDKKYNKGRKKFREYCLKVFKVISKEYKIDTFVMPKVNDDWAVDCIMALNEGGYKLLVDDRESIITSQRMKVVAPKLKELLNIKFDRLLVHNELHKKLFLDAGVPEKLIEVNGMPQTDYWFSQKCWKDGKSIHSNISSEKIKILYFSFGPRTYMNFYYGDEKRDWSSLCADYHDVILKILEESSDRVQIIYKTGGKPLRDLYPGFETFQAGAKRYIENHSLLMLDGSYSSFDLIRNCDLVLGFQTSGLLEAMFTDVPIVYGGWGELFDEIKDTLLPLHECEGVHHAKSRDDLYGIIRAHLFRKITRSLSEDQRQSRIRMRDIYFNRADGAVSRRLLRAVKEISKNSSHGGQG
ncbi:hypothetical protein [Thalassospira povalilytica]|uniref:Uncharacterized protein n=1 Tax=Thalassospira povalilytica TaxID=732237 RepID=A0A8I1SGW9_9PROT|nr:hypothetical protein [Thalassospira povalilytica]MBN8195907.1 hypothetical protein [Thalassospira povalilytica]